ncbi:MAG: adenosylcobinamide-GDP ribazoletransferase [Polyangiaceae bacterium]|nr:adenosylcobinamide-GDP ribazoletransferase [Polyangiaceae bacterium]
MESKLPAPLRGLRACFVFLTRIPLGGFPYSAEDFRWAAAHAPLVGYFVGGLTGLVFWLLLPIGELGAAGIAVAVSLLVTGAFHEDGLADTADALGGGYTRAKVLEILKDSRVGAFGAAALCISLLIRVALIAQLGPSGLWALPLVGAAARVGPIVLIATLPYVTDEKFSKSGDLSRAGWLQTAVATLWLVAGLAFAHYFRWLTPERTGCLVLSLALITIVTGYRYYRRVGGVTGDFLGATEQIGEIAALVILTWK